ncbi:hypothetical protein [Nonomuraea sp. NPDC050643]|uniref:hypothetical protein n=1 Tax=Nonomuraea sp. NPDC050643 TaxID=3155660 RepID=UPI0033D51A06
MISGEGHVVDLRTRPALQAANSAGSPISTCATGGRRIAWAALPEQVTAGIERLLGGDWGALIFEEIPGRLPASRGGVTNSIGCWRRPPTW